MKMTGASPSCFSFEKLARCRVRARTDSRSEAQIFSVIRRAAAYVPQTMKLWTGSMSGGTAASGSVATTRQGVFVRQPLDRATLSREFFPSPPMGRAVRRKFRHQQRRVSRVPYAIHYRRARPYAGHPRLVCVTGKAWMAGSTPGSKSGGTTMKASLATPFHNRISFPGQSCPIGGEGEGR